MTAAIPDDIKQIGDDAGIALRFALADIAPHEAAALWSSGGAIELVNEAFARAIIAERERQATSPVAYIYEFEDGCSDQYGAIFGAVHEVNGVRTVMRTPLFAGKPEAIPAAPSQPTGE